jgi:hypothetical protein
MRAHPVLALSRASLSGVVANPRACANGADASMVWAFLVHMTAACPIVGSGVYVQVAEAIFHKWVPGVTLCGQMPITLKDMLHGGALIQIAEFPTFKAINSFEPRKDEKSKAAFIINTNTGVYFKYGTNPNKRWKEYSFVFNKANFEELDALKAKFGDRAFIGLVCVKAREVCILSATDLYAKRDERTAANGSPEDQYQLLVAVRPRQSFRVYMNAPGVKKTSLAQTVVSRNDFPQSLFD